MLRKFYRFYKNHYYEMTGAIIGLIIGLSLVFLGVLNTIIVALCIGAGLFIGKKLKTDKNFIKNILDKILPPGSYR